MAATTIDIKLFVDEGKSSSDALLFDNGKASVGVAIAVKVTGNAENPPSVEDVTLCEFKENDSAVTNLTFTSIEDAKEAYPLSLIGAEAIDSFDKLPWGGHPDNTAQPVPDGLDNHKKHRFMVKSAGKLGQHEKKQCRIVAAVEVKNYVPSGGMDPVESVVFFSVLDAMNSANVHITLSSSVNITVAWKPNVVISHSSIQPLNNNYSRNSNFEMDHGGTYTYTASYGEHHDYCDFVLHDVKFVYDVTSSNTNMYGSYIDVSDENKIKCIRRKGNKSWNNQVAAAFWHGDLSSGTVTQNLNKGHESHYDFSGVGPPNYVGSSGCYELENDSVAESNCDEGEFNTNASLSVYDSYGGASKICLKPHLNVDTDKKGEARIDHSDIEIISN